MTWRVISDFQGFCIDSAHPDGFDKNFRKHERINGDRQDTGGGLCTIAGMDVAIFGVPVSSITPDGKSSRMGRQATMT